MTLKGKTPAELDDDDVDDDVDDEDVEGFDLRFDGDDDDDESFPSPPADSSRRPPRLELFLFIVTQLWFSNAKTNLHFDTHEVLRDRKRP